MNSSEIMDLLGSVGDGPYVKNVDIVIVIETSENMSRVVDDIKNLDFSVDGFLNYLGSVSYTHLTLPTKLEV